MFLIQAFPIFGFFQAANQMPGWLLIVMLILLVFLLVWVVSRAVSSNRKRDEDVMSRSTMDRQDAADQGTSSAPSYNMEDKTPSGPEMTPIPMTAPESLAEPETVEEVETWESKEGFAEVVNEPVAVDETVVDDDLEIIEGIGPRIADMLRAEGVHTFDQLANTPSERLTMILQSEGLSLADPSSWHEQARLAAAGDMVGLKAYQEQLKGGHVE